MVLLIASVLCAVTCAPIRAGQWEYLSAACAQDVFYRWYDIPEGQRPAHCDESADCLPMAWAECPVVRRFLVSWAPTTELR